MNVGDRVFIIAAKHPASGHTGTIREVQTLSSLFGGGIGYAVEVDGMAGHRVGCRAPEIRPVDAMLVKRPKRRRARR